MMMKSASVLLALALSVTACQAFVAVPLVGYQQGVMLQIAPPAILGGQCLVYGVPTADGYADHAQSPVFLHTPQNTGSHNLQFDYNQALYTVSPFLAPGQTKLQIDATDAANPLISFVSPASPIGQSGAVTVFLSDKTTGAVSCSSQIQFTVDQPLACLPTSVSSNDDFVIPSGSVYAPSFVQNTVIQEFITINNININEIIINVINISNNTIIPKPPTPPPVNCTATPSNPVCHNVIVPPAPSPHVAPKPSPPHNGPTVQPPKPSPPTVQPPKASPPTVQPPKASPPQATPPSEPTSIPTIQPISPTSVPSATPQPALPPTVNTVTPLSSSTPVVTAGPPMLPMPTLTVTPQGPLQSTAISYGRRLMQVARPQQ